MGLDPVMGKRSHWENIGVDKETLSSVSLFDLTAYPGGEIRHTCKSSVNVQ